MRVLRMQGGEEFRDRVLGLFCCEYKAVVFVYFLGLDLNKLWSFRGISDQ